MKHQSLYLFVFIALGVVLLFSMGEILWGSSPGKHWTEMLFLGICHNLPDRTFSADGYFMAVNKRCFGIFTGLWFGWGMIPWLKSITDQKKWPIWILLFAVVIQIIDYTGNLFHIWENTNHSRALLGMALGIAVPTALADQFQLQKTKKTDR